MIRRVVVGLVMLLGVNGVLVTPLSAEETCFDVCLEDLELCEEFYPGAADYLFDLDGFDFFSSIPVSECFVDDGAGEGMSPILILPETYIHQIRPSDKENIRRVEFLRS